MIPEISQLHFPQSSQAEGKARRKHRHHGDFGSVIVYQDNSFSETKSQAAHRQLQPNQVRLMYQNLHFAPVARFYVGLKTCMAQLAGLAKLSCSKRRLRHSPEEGEGVDVAVHLRFHRRRRIGPEEISIALQQVHDEEVGLLLSAVDRPARIQEMAAQDAVKRVPKIARNLCPKLAKCAFWRGVAGAN